MRKTSSVFVYMTPNIFTIELMMFCSEGEIFFFIFRTKFYEIKFSFSEIKILFLHALFKTKENLNIIHVGLRAKQYNVNLKTLKINPLLQNMRKVSCNNDYFTG